MLFWGITRSLLIALLSVSVLWDIRKRRIPNVLSALIALSGILTSLLDEGWRASLSGLAAAVVTFMVLSLLWQRGWLGGGDVKLAASCASWVGLPFLYQYLLAAALAGGVVALVCYALSSRLIRREISTNMRFAAFGLMPEPPSRSAPGRVSVPYGLAVAIGVLFIVLYRKGW